MAEGFPTRKLGKNGPDVPALGFGAMGLSMAYGDGGDDESRLQLLDRAFELGERFWDTADVYNDNEDLLGKWFKRTGHRDKIFLATKFAIKYDPVAQAVTTDSSPEYVKQACATSLKRLGVEHIDLYYCHRLDKTTPIEKTVEAMAELKKEGKIRYIGLSEVSAETLRRASKVTHIDALQIEYSPFAMEIEDPKINVLKTCRELGIATVAYSPLSRGFVTGTIRSNADIADDDFRKHIPRFSDEHFPNNLKLVDALKDLAEKKKCTPSQLTLAWLLAQGDDIFPIPGTKKIKYLEENLGAVKVQLSAEENAAIRKVVENATVMGERYPAAMLGNLFADSAPLVS
ncbi:MAG: hypothetical protein M1825_005577 [Sarcosagium campestre]|nr:MAG: hypothetical protein M1825_005577 [Sarcosagium campestre]